MKRARPCLELTVRDQPHGNDLELHTRGSNIHHDEHIHDDIVADEDPDADDVGGGFDCPPDEFPAGLLGGLGGALSVQENSADGQSSLFLVQELSILRILRPNYCKPK